MGLASSALHSLVDNLLLRRQPAREIRGRQGVLRHMLSQTKTPRSRLCRIGEGHGEASRARAAVSGRGDSAAGGNGLQWSLEGRRIHSVRLRRDAAGVSSHRGTGATSGNLRQRRLATQLLLCQGALAMPIPKKDGLPVMCSPRGVLLEVRREIASQSKSSQPFTERIALRNGNGAYVPRRSKSVNGLAARHTGHRSSPYC